MEIEPPVPDIETEWVVLEKDRYIRQRVNSRIAQKNFSRIESIKEELKRMKSENEEILFNAEFGFDNNTVIQSPLFTSDENTENYTPRKDYKERYVSWNGKQKKSNYQQRGCKGLEKSYSMDDVFQMSFMETESEEKPRDRKSKKNSYRDCPDPSSPRNQISSVSGTQNMPRGETMCFDQCHFDLESKRRTRRKMSQETNL